MPKLWVTDEELIEESGVPRDKMRAALRYLDGQRPNIFPRKQPAYGDRRYFPAVLEFWRATERR